MTSRRNDWDADWTPAGATWWDYLMGALVLVLLSPLVLLIWIFEGGPHE